MTSLKTKEDCATLLNNLMIVFFLFARICNAKKSSHSQLYIEWVSYHQTLPKTKVFFKEKFSKIIVTKINNVVCFVM